MANRGRTRQGMATADLLVRRHARRCGMLALTLTALLFAGLAAGPARGVAATDPCAAPVRSPVACENTKPGDPASDWQVSGIGDTTIQGFATAMSVQPGQTISFKVKTPASSYHLDILRLGYYNGDGARKIAANVRPSAALPQSQPACLTDSSTGLIDCGNWGVSASWTVPSDAVSGVYIAHLVRDDTGGSSQIPFVVRDDSSHSDVLVTTSDATWEAYNAYGGNSLYTCTVACPPGNPKAYKAAFAVSYNRPWDGAANDLHRSYLYYAEYQMIRYLERNGFDVSYTSDVDVDANAAPLLNHKAFISSGHDEYWSGRMRANVEAARDAGVSLAFFSGNEVFWKTRYAGSGDGTATPGRTIVTYKDTHFDAQTDPTGTWTGTWRDPRFSPPGDGGRPENSLTGQYFLVNSGSGNITVPSTYSKLRFWRNTAVAGLASGQTQTLAPGQLTLGYEWDVDSDNFFRPAGTIRLSSTSVSGPETFTDFGSTTISPGPTTTHNMTLYRASSGALVFGAGTVQWAWGLDTTNPWTVSGPANVAPDATMQQATMNLLVDMGAQPVTPAAGLVASNASGDSVAPTSAITSPAQGTSVADGSTVTISGTASDVGGVVAGVEVSTDGGATWHPATGTTSWSYTWTAAHGAPAATLEVRATDDSGNIQTLPGTVSLAVSCPCGLWGANVKPATVDSADPTAVEVGVKFRSDQVGTINGVKFYKASTNTGTHVGNLWKSDGTLLARGTFSGESASGWQTLTFASPVQINANTTYVASYFAPAGHYSVSEDYFWKPSPTGGTTLDSPPLHTPVSNNLGNGVYTYAASTSFPGLSGDGENYAVDVIFAPSQPPGQVTGAAAAGGAGSATVTWSAPSTGGPVTDYTVTPFVGTTAQAPTIVSGTPPVTSAYVNNLTAGTSYTFTVQASNPNGAGPVSGASNAVTPSAATAPGAPTGVAATPADGAASLKWTAPPDGGRTITAYTVTPYANGVAQTATIIAGAGGGTAPTSASITGLTNGTAYTFTVAATNVLGAGAPSAQSNVVTPGPVPLFVQKVTGRNPSAAALAVTPTSNVTAGDRIVVMAGVWSGAGATASGVSDSAGNTYTKVTSIKGTDDTELSVWSAPVTLGGGTKPAITVRASGTADIGAAALEYKNLSPSSTVIDKSVTAAGTASTSGFVSSGPTAPATADNELAMGFYVDSGFARPLASDPGFSERVNVSPTNDMEFVVDDVLAQHGDTPAARVSTGAGTPWAMATVIFKSTQASAPTAPSPPTGVTATAGDAKATVSWTTPSDGGSPITGYTVIPYIGTVSQPPVSVPATATSATVTGLTNGTAYTFRVTATNAIGTSLQSAASAAVTPSAPTAPGAPTNVTATAGNAKATLSWTAPADGGSPVTGYTITPYNGTTAGQPTTVTGSPAPTSATVSALTNGQTYTFKVAATNAIGTGPDSTASNAVTPSASTPPAFVQQVSARNPATSSLALVPTSSVAAGDRLVVMTGTWSAARDTVSAVTDSAGNSYVKLKSFTASDDTEMSLWTAPVAAGGGTRPTVTVRTTGTADVGAALLEYSGLSTVADASAVDVLASAVGKTTAAGSVSSGATAATAADNELAIGFYVDSGFGATLGADAAYASRVNVSPQNDMEFVAEDRLVAAGSTPAATVRTGASIPWLMATVVFKTGAPAPPTAPAAPSNVTATAGDGKATVSWTAPASGGSPITSYTVTPYVGTTAQTPVTVSGAPPATSTTVPGLTNGTSYTFRVSATNSVGTGPDSTASVAVTPSGPTAPAAPTGVTATAGNGTATVSWAAPASGGSAITSYTVTPYVGTNAQTPVTITGTPPATSTTVGGLTNGTAYTFKVSATNAIGTGPDSAASNAVTPTAPTAPAAPTGVIAVPGNAKATVSWTAPANGGSAITGYTVTPYAGTAPQTPVVVSGTPPATSATVTGLVNGTAYTFKVSATNAIGAGPDSAASAPVTPTALATPAFVQQVTKRVPNGKTNALVPTSNITTGDRLVVEAGVWSASNATASGVTDSAGNIYTKVTSVKASDQTELSIWTAPITAGGGTKPTITVTATGTADIGAAAVEYGGLSTASGAAAVDKFATATGKTSAAATVASGPTAATTGDQELAVGFYADSGFGATLGADATFTQRVNVSPTNDMEFLVEDKVVSTGATPSATVRTGAAIPWLMGTVVFRNAGG